MPCYLCSENQKYKSTETSTTKVQYSEVGNIQGNVNLVASKDNIVGEQAKQARHYHRGNKWKSEIYLYIYIHVYILVSERSERAQSCSCSIEISDVYVYIYVYIYVAISQVICACSIVQY